ncbi:MAG TPA: outer membrane beta-barrel protein [Thermoanaerobaculia bacterium]
MRKVCLIVLFIVAATPAVFAQSWREGDRGRDRDRYYRRYQDNRFELTPFGGYTWGGTIFSDTTNLFNQDVTAASSGNYGLNFGIPIGYSNMKLELMVNRQDTSLTAGGGGLFEPDNRIANFHVTYYHGGLLIPFNASRNVTPFVVVSAGVGNLQPDMEGVSASNRFSASAGVGVKVPVSENFGVRLEGRGFFTSLGASNNFNDCRRCSDSGGHDFYQGQVNLGFVISF